MYQKLVFKSKVRYLTSGKGYKILTDNFSRIHNYLRISITEKCNLRCTYCMPEDGIKLQHKNDYLCLDELKRISKIFVQCGVNKIRITGGEPTIDKKLIPFLSFLNQLKPEGLNTIAMTTNGLSLSKFAKTYRSLGLDAINISLDTLKEARYEQIARQKGFKLAYRGILSALDSGFKSVKLNCVVISEFNDDEILDFVDLAHKYPMEVRFIEFMPFASNNWKSNKMVTYRDMLEIIKSKYPDIKHTIDLDCHNQVSKVYKTDSMKGSIGFISSITDNFCSTCNRLRITADGYLKTCLFSKDEVSLRGLMRNGATDAEIVSTIKTCLDYKKRRHGGIENILSQQMRPMVRIGSARMLHHNLADNSIKKTDLNHVDGEGRATMVNIGDKKPIRRLAQAEGKIIVGKTVIERLEKLKKGDVITVAKVAGLMGAKITSQLIPMCHQIELDNVSVDVRVCNDSHSLIVTSFVEATHKTGVEMESLTAVTVTLLTIYDMCKSLNNSMVITDVRLLSKVKVTSIQ